MKTIEYEKPLIEVKCIGTCDVLLNSYDESVGQQEDCGIWSPVIPFNI